MTATAAVPAVEPAVEIDGVRKTFGATTALDDVSFTIAPGAVHALLGENGAGKSTLVKLMSGLMRPTAGAIRVNGDPHAGASPRAAHALGVQTAFQEMTLVRDLTVLDNLLLPYAPMGPTGLIRRRAARAAARAHLDDLGFDVDLDADISELELSVRQKIEIARALWRKPKRPAARRADLDAGEAATSTGSARSSPARRRAARRSSSSPTGCARSAPSATR